LSHGSLPAKLREQISLVIAEENGCGYCRAAHSAIGKMVGLSADAINGARHGDSQDAKARAALQFARIVTQKKGRVSDADLAQVRRAGYNDAEVSEIIANVALNIFTNYFNEAANTEIDFPKVVWRLPANVRERLWANTPYSNVIYPTVKKETPRCCE